LPQVGTLEVLVIILAILLFGPKRIPEIARTLGSITAQLRRASDEFFREISLQTDDLAQEEVDGTKEPDAGKREGKSESKEPTDEQVAKAAEALGIKTEGKTKEQLKNEIISRLYSSSDPYGLDADKAP